MSTISDYSTIKKTWSKQRTNGKKKNAESPQHTLHKQCFTTRAGVQNESGRLKHPGGFIRTVKLSSHCRSCVTNIASF